ncbi:LacI family DNA-binding transcriptional regulator [Leucobacter triazinivorans]|uniref:LacI family transcriptional regulator n=1 Tax=Leucobacter triazinivorans TaxID=1784719 RepID=A0A4P6KE78_9MICO|nr:LacI family DNA-binding transcriptional regulator [Leucobacter triazinivorans]QBE48410.1 LacI family transcriptional regulator [Leucobacter triazinivorans]
MMVKKTGLVDIAREAGVSTATVSRVLNDSEKVTAKTRERVLAVVERLNFRPDLSASTLRRGRSKTIGIAVASISQPWYVKLIRALRAEITSRGYTTVVYDLEHSDDVLIEHMENAISLRLAGMVLATGDRLDAAGVHGALENVAASIPLVVIGQRTAGANWPTVRFDDFEASRRAAAELISRRARPLLVIARSTTSHLAQLRVSGALAALHEHPALQGGSHVVDLEGPMSFEVGYAIGSGLGERLRQFGAVFCVNDELALGLARAASEIDIRIPGDLLVLGYGDIDVLPFLTPSLSSVSGDAQHVARDGLSALFSMIQDQPYAEDVIVERSIIHRESTSC